MSGIFEINAELREGSGKGASRRLRREKKVPAIMYGGAKNRKPQAITIQLNELVKSLENEAFYSHVLTVNVNGKAEQALLMDIQRHPATDFPMHVDFERVTKTSNVHKRVPLHFVGEEKIVKSGGVVQHVASDVEINCKVADLPEYIEVDVTGLTIGSSIHLSEIKLPKGVTLTELHKGDDHDVPVVSVLKAGNTTAADEAEDAENAEGDTPAE